VWLIEPEPAGLLTDPVRFVLRLPKLWIYPSQPPRKRHFGAEATAATAPLQVRPVVWANCGRERGPASRDLSPQRGLGSEMPASGR